MNAAIAQQREAVEAVGFRLSRGPAAIRVGAEEDDLVQEGLIQVWQNLERGVDPLHYVEFRMKDYIRWLGAQIGIPRDTEEFIVDDETGLPIKNPNWPPTQHVSYDTLLPMDDFRASESR
jgi:hypothetical protein